LEISLVDEESQRWREFAELCINYLNYNHVTWEEETLWITWTSVEFVGLRDVTATELDALSDLRSDGGARVAARRDRVQVGGTRERVACVVHDAVEVVRLAERVYLGRRQRVEVVLLPCNAPASSPPTTDSSS